MRKLAITVGILLSLASPVKADPPTATEQAAEECEGSSDSTCYDTFLANFFVVKLAEPIVLTELPRTE